LTNTSISIPTLIPGWIKHLREFLCATKCALWFEDQSDNIKSRRENDHILMDDIYKSGLTPTDQIQLNWVRLFLRVETLADISNIRGNKILD
jgi:hypothetical protein